jgi:S-(hydroxymethyl)glutathione dehydrogenase/alcohol dehydrogenase
MKSLAAVLVKKKKIELLELEIPILKYGHVLVKNLFSGICHTQKLEYEGKRGIDKFYPHCFGHESVAKVIEIGPGVKKVKIDDLVIVSWIKGKGIDASGPIYKTKNNKTINSGPVSVFSEYSIVSENRVYIKPKILDIKDAVFFGCAVPTGMGSVKNISNLNIKKNLCILGCGGVGTFSLLAAYYSGFKDILVIDNQSKKLNIAKNINVRTFLNKNKNLEIKKILKKNNNSLFNVVIESTGNINVMQDAINLVKNLDGRLILNGNAEHGKQIKINPLVFNQGKAIIGSFGGSSNLDIDIDYYCKIFNKIPFNIRDAFSKIYQIQELETAFKEIKNSNFVRGVIKF